MIRIEVAVAAPLTQTLTYSCPTAKGDPVPGVRVLVPLGSRKITGYVLAVIADEDVPYKIRSITRILDQQPLFHPEMIPFFKWISEYYHYPLGEVIKTALPGGLITRSEKILAVTEKGLLDDNWQSKNSWSVRLEKDKSLSGYATKKLLTDSKTKKEITSLIDQGLLDIKLELAKASASEKKEDCFSLSTAFDCPGLEKLHPCKEDYPSALLLIQQATGFKFKQPALHVLILMASIGRKIKNGVVPRKELRKQYTGYAKPMQLLVDTELIHKLEKRVYRNPFGEQLAFFPRPDTLTDEQQEVLEHLIPAVQKQEFAPFLLHGVTGCGKTEVYLRAAEETLAIGRDVLFLVPEIALATQLEAHLISRFGDNVVLLHSGMSQGQRLDQWSLAASGKAKIVIGARSAVFAPLKNPGLIVVDEEHDAGFKQDDMLRYQGRDLAILRARMQKGVVLLGSATPSITSYYHAVSGKYSLLTINKRVHQRPLPAVTVVDLKKEKNKGKRMVFGKDLREGLEENLVQKNQSILLLNRRGFAAVNICRDCGTAVKCKHCQVSLTLHKGRNQLLCHYCGYSVTDNLICSSCYSENIAPVGFGTERIEQEIQELFPTARVARLDTDTAANKKHFLAILKQMHEGEIDILIGTQMIAKGHHFPNVTLVGVVWADGGLHMPDFRAAERTYQLLSQVTGRAGRGEKNGRVIIQTLKPEHYSIQFARKHDYNGLYEHEIGNRTDPAFPPFVRLIALHINGSREKDVQQVAMAVGRQCRAKATSLSEKGLKPDVQVLGPAPAPIDRIRDKYRWQILLKGTSSQMLHDMGRFIAANRAQLVVNDVRIAIDVDPENMM